METVSLLGQKNATIPKEQLTKIYLLLAKVAFYLLPRILAQMLMLQTLTGLFIKLLIVVNQLQIPVETMISIVVNSVMMETYKMEMDVRAIATGKIFKKLMDRHALIFVQVWVMTLLSAWSQGCWSLLRSNIFRQLSDFLSMEQQTRKLLTLL